MPFMQTTTTITSDAVLLMRVASMRATVQSHRDKAQELWNRCAPAEHDPQDRAALGKFTQKLARCE